VHNSENKQNAEVTYSQDRPSLTASLAEQPGKAGTRKLKTNRMLIKQEMTRWQWYQLNYMEIICIFKEHITYLLQ